MKSFLIGVLLTYGLVVTVSGMYWAKDAQTLERKLKELEG